MRSCVSLWISRQLLPLIWTKLKDLPRINADKRGSSYPSLQCQGCPRSILSGMCSVRTPKEGVTPHTSTRNLNHLAWDIPRHPRLGFSDPRFSALISGKLLSFSISRLPPCLAASVVNGRFCFSNFPITRLLNYQICDHPIIAMGSPSCIPRSKELTGFIPSDARVAQHRGPRQARFWPVGVEEPSAVLRLCLHRVCLLRSPFISGKLLLLRSRRCRAMTSIAPLPGHPRIVSFLPFRSRRCRALSAITAMNDEWTCLWRVWLKASD